MPGGIAATAAGGAAAAGATGGGAGTTGVATSGDTAFGAASFGAATFRAATGSDGRALFTGFAALRARALSSDTRTQAISRQLLEISTRHVLPPNLNSWTSACAALLINATAAAVRSLRIESLR